MPAAFPAPPGFSPELVDETRGVEVGLRVWREALVNPLGA